MTADVVEFILYLLHFLADPKDQADGRPSPGRSIRWSRWLVASNVVVGVGFLGLFGSWTNLGESSYSGFRLMGLVLGAGCLGLAAWMFDETDLASRQSPNQVSCKPKLEPNRTWDEL